MVYISATRSTVGLMVAALVNGVFINVQGIIAAGAHRTNMGILFNQSQITLSSF